MARPTWMTPTRCLTVIKEDRAVSVTARRRLLCAVIFKDLSVRWVADRSVAVRKEGERRKKIL